MQDKDKHSSQLSTCITRDFSFSGNIKHFNFIIALVWGFGFTVAVKSIPENAKNVKPVQFLKTAFSRIRITSQNMHFC